MTVKKTRLSRWERLTAHFFGLLVLLDLVVTRL